MTVRSATSVISPTRRGPRRLFSPVGVSGIVLTRPNAAPLLFLSGGLVLQIGHRRIARWVIRSVTGRQTRHGVVGRGVEEEGHRVPVGSPPKSCGCRGHVSLGADLPRHHSLQRRCRYDGSSGSHSSRLFRAYTCRASRPMTA